MKQRGGKGGGSEAGGDTQYLGSGGSLQRWPGWVGVREGIQFTPEYQTRHVSLWNPGIPRVGKRGITWSHWAFPNLCIVFQGKKKILFYIDIFIFIYIIYRECSWMGPRSVGDSWSGGEGAPGFGGDFWQNPWGSAGLGMLFGGMFVPLEK